MKRMFPGLLVAMLLALALLILWMKNDAATATTGIVSALPKTRTLEIVIRAPGQNVSCSYGTVTTASRNKRDTEADWTSNWSIVPCNQRLSGDVSCSIRFRQEVELPRFQCALHDPNRNIIRYACSKQSQLLDGESFTLSGPYILTENVDPSSDGHNCQLL